MDMEISQMGNTMVYSTMLWAVAMVLKPSSVLQSWYIEGRVRGLSLSPLVDSDRRLPSPKVSESDLQLNVDLLVSSRCGF